jgi:hypothetical protein
MPLSIRWLNSGCRGAEVRKEAAKSGNQDRKISTQCRSFISAIINVRFCQKLSIGHFIVAGKLSALNSVIGIYDRAA